MVFSINKYILLILFVLSCFLLNAQQVKISGKIADSVSDDILPFANISVLTKTDSVFVTGTTSDEKGNFEIRLSENGEYLIRFSFISYITRYDSVNIDDNTKELDIGSIGLVQSSEMLNDVEVVARKPMYQYDNEKKVYNVTEDPSVQDGVATDALQNSPGVYVDMEGNITLRGVSSVEIWINDKPSRITGEGLKSFLQQLPANTLDRIEVITNPTARFSSEGSGGIINIITKEKIKRHFLISGGINASTRPNYNPWLSYIWSKDKWSFNTYLSRYGNQWRSDNHTETIALSDTSILYNTISDSEYESNYTGNWLNFYTAYEADSLNEIELWLGAGLGYNSSESGYSLEKTGYNPDYNYTRLEDYTSSSKDDPNQDFYIGASYNRKFKKDGHKLLAEISTGRWGGGLSINEGNREYSEMPWRNRRTLYNSKYLYESFSLDIDYTNPLNNNSAKLESGINISSRPNSNIQDVDTLNKIIDSWDFVPQFSDDYTIEKIKYQPYAMYSDSLWKFSYKAGLRGEYRQYEFNSKSTDSLIDRTDFNLFPTLHIAYSTKNNFNISTSYSRRVNYPDYQMNPFVSYEDEESLSRGNSALIPAFTDSYEFNIARFFEKGSSVSMSVYHRRTKNDIEGYRTIIYDPIIDGMTRFYTYLNVGMNIYTGSEFTVNYVFGKYRCMLNFDMYYYDVEADFPTYSTKKEELQYTGKLILMANYKYLKLNTRMIYKSSSVNITGESDAVYYLSLNASTDLFDRKLSLRIGIQDLFNWQESSGSTITPTLISEYTRKRVTRYVSFGLTIRFGRTELESKSKNVQTPMGG